MIPQTFIEEIQTRTDIVDLISGYFPLKKTGGNFKALCPFHREKTPSFLVSPQKQIFHCFGCGEGGGVIQFLMLHEKVSFTEAVETLAKKLGLNIPYQKKEEKTKTQFFEAVNEASLCFHRNLLNDEVCRPVLFYLKKRGVDEATIKEFRIGFAYGRNTLLNFLRKTGITLEVMEKTSLIIPKEEGFRDLFWERITFPVFDIRSRVLGFGARAYKEGEGIPKYINSLESSLYHKREHLYGLNFSRDEIIKNDRAIIVEGYLDMIIPYAAGIKNIVGSCGTALSLEQIQLIKRYASNIVLVFDSDKAGELASLRALDLLLESDLKVRIATLPSGEDPASCVTKKGKDYFLSILDRGCDFLDYKVGVWKKTFDLGSIEGKTRISKEVLSTIAKLKSEVEKYEYIKKLARILEIKEEILIAEYRKLFAAKPTLTVQDTFGKVQREPLPLTERIILKFMLSHREVLSLIKKNLNEGDFTSSLISRAVAYIFKNFSKDTFSSNFLGRIEDKEVSGLIAQILMDDSIPLDKENFKKSIIKLKKRRVKSLHDNLREELRQAETNGDDERRRELISRFYKMKGGQ